MLLTNFSCEIANISLPRMTVQMTSPTAVQIGYFLLWSTSGELSIIFVLWQVCISPLLLCDLTDDCGDRCVFQPNVFNQSHAGLMRTDSTAMRTLSDKPTLRSLTSRLVCFNHLAWDCFSGKLDLAKQAIRGQVQLLTTQSATAQGITFSLTAVKIQLRTA